MADQDRTESGQDDYGGLTTEQVAEARNDLVRFAVETSRPLTSPIDQGRFKEILHASLQNRLQEVDGLPIGKANTVARKLIDEYFDLADRGTRKTDAQE